MPSPTRVVRTAAEIAASIATRPAEEIENIDLQELLIEAIETDRKQLRGLQQRIQRGVPINTHDVVSAGTKIAIVPLAESSHLWDLELHSGYLHAGYEFDDSWELCETAEQIRNTASNQIVLDVLRATDFADDNLDDPDDETAYRTLCDLAAAAAGRGYALYVALLGD